MVYTRNQVTVGAEAATAPVDSLHVTYRTESDRQHRNQRIKRIAAGAGVAVSALLFFEGKSIPVNGAEHATTVAVGLAVGVAYNRSRRGEQEGRERASDALEQAVSHSDPRWVGDKAAPIQSWIITALPEDQADELMNRILRAHEDEVRLAEVRGRQRQEQAPSHQEL